MNKVYIYALIDPSLDKVFYVGSSNNPVVRTRTHFRDGTPIDTLNRAISEMKRKGVKPSYRIVDETTEDDRVDKEKFWIRKYQEDGHPIINQWGRLPVELNGYQPEPADGGRVPCSAMLTKEQVRRIEELVQRTGSSKSEVMRGLICFALEYIK